MITTLNYNHSNYFEFDENLYQKLQATPLENPKLVSFNKEACDLIGLDYEACETQNFIDFINGIKVLKGSVPYAMGYAGHQFGHFTMLGDGRAILIGEHITNGNKRFDIQLKGSGKTSFSRNGDGRAALGPMLREYIISEAMHNLNIPSTRSLAVAKTGEKIWCEDCEMKLNSQTQWEAHKIGRKHIKNVKHKGKSSSEGSQLFDMPESKTVETAPQAPRPPPQQATEQTDPPASLTWQPSPQWYVMPQWYPQGLSPHEYWLAWHTQWAARYNS